MRSTPLLLTLAAILATGGAPGQEAASPLATVEAIRALGPDELEAESPVRLEGVVIFAGIVGFTIHDGESGLQVTLERSLPRPSLGDRVRIEGVTGITYAGGRPFPLVLARRVEPLGQGVLPEPVETSVRDLVDFRHWEQRVSLEAWVLDQSWSNGEHHLFLADSEAWALVHVRHSPREAFPKDLVGARIRATGVNQGFDRSAMNAMMLPDPSHWSIVEEPPPDAFDRPILPLTELSDPDAPRQGLVKVRGRLTHALPEGHWFLRDESGRTFRVTGITPMQKPAPQEGECSSAKALPDARPGDEIESVGFPVATGTDLWFRFCQARLVSSGGAAPAPQPTTLGAVLAGEATNQLAPLKGRLLEKQTALLAPGRHRALLVLEDRGKRLGCRLESGDPDPFAGLAVDDLVEVAGLVPGNEASAGASLLLRSREDAVSHGLSPAVLLRRFWIGAGLALLLLALSSVWILSLRRSLARTEAAETSVRELNANLEDRVRERTEELETARTELDRALELERELGVLKSRFVAMVSHEFRTPLGVTMSALELLRHYRERLPSDKQGELLDDIFSATLRMSGMMEQILILGRADSGKMNFRPVPLDLPALVRQIHGDALSASGRANPLETLFDGDLAPVSLDESLVRLILGNLLSNAVKYSPPESPVHVRASREGDTVEIEIADEGIGIPAEDQVHLFEAFHRAGNVGETSGTGLGLLLVKRCVEIHHGTITFESEADRGTTFRVTLPVAAG